MVGERVLDPKDPHNRIAVKELQGKLNQLHRAMGIQGDVLEVSGNWDKKSQDIWLLYKKNLWVNDKLTIAYLTDEKGLEFNQKEMEKMGFRFEKGPKDSQEPVITFNGTAYSPDGPPEAVIQAVQERLTKKGLLKGERKRGDHETEGKYMPGKLDDATKRAIILQKRAEWVDGRINDGAREELDTWIRDLERKQEKMKEAFRKGQVASADEPSTSYIPGGRGGTRGAA